MKHFFSPFLILILLGALHLSCTTTGHQSKQSDAAAEALEAEAGQKDLGPSDKIVVPGGIDFTDQEYRHLYRTHPVDGKPAFFVAVTRMYNREEEYEMGRRLLARQAAIFYQADVEATSVTVSSSRFEGAREKVQVDYNKGLLAEMLERIRVIEYYEDARGTYMKGVLTGVTLPDFSYTKEIQNDLPAWLHTQPEFPGYITAVGVSQRQMFFASSLLKSEEQALASMARQFSIGVNKKRDDIEIGGLGSSFKQSNVEEVSTTVKGFYILDRWISKDGNTYYSLAVCPVK